MEKTQAILAVAVFVLIGMIFYSYWSGNDLGWWLKGWAIFCAAAYVFRLYTKFRGKG